MYKIGETTNNTTICMVTDGNQTYRGDHFMLYKNTESLGYIPESNIKL